MWPDVWEKIDVELASIRKLFEAHSRLLNKVRCCEPDSVELSALSAFLHSFYTGVENAFKRISVEIDGSPPAGDRWHIDLISIMAEATAKRPAVISADVCLKLVQYLQFRHFFRHAYTFDIKWNKMSALVFDAKLLLDTLETELHTFFAEE